MIKMLIDEDCEKGKAPHVVRKVQAGQKGRRLRAD